MATRLATSRRPWRETAINCSPAIQPSVLDWRAATSPGLRSRFITSVQERPGFLQGEEELGAADLDQLIARSQPAQGQRRIGAGHDDQVKLRRQIPEEEGDGVVNRRGLDQVVVVQDEDQVVLQVAQVVEERGQDCPGRRGLRGESEQVQGSRAHTLLCTREGPRRGR